MSPPLPSPDLVARFTADVDALTGADQQRFGVALSGGPDSLALLMLAAAAFPGRIAAATVDHRLRAEAAAEAALAARHCEALRVPHHILAVNVVAAGRGVQAEARSVRYRALEGWMREHRIGALMTAHHVDDQAETLVMRLLRGSGVGGLAGIRAVGRLPEGGLLLRPLLGWRAAELAEIVAASGLEAADDPSNRDEAFDRARIRRLLGETLWLDSPAFARSASALAEAEEALEFTARRLIAERVGRVGDEMILDPAGLPPELLRRLVLHCLSEIAPGAAPRGEQVGRLIAQLQSGSTATLAGIRCVGGATFRFSPAPPRRLRP